MVDIIIPAYNCSETLPRTLGSIVAQTKKEKCIVTVVDDCSTEDLKPIIDSFKPYIKINYIKLEKNLKYPGLVRQVGLDNTIAPYVMFLDSDDVLAPSAVQILNNEMLKKTYDLIVGFFYRQEEHGNLILMGENDTTWLHGNIYRRSFLEENNIRFPSGYNEDGAFNTQCYMLSSKIGMLKIPIYYWLYNKKSITREENEADFSLRYADHIVSTLNFAYQNVFNHNGRTKKTIINLGTHYGLFCGLLEKMLNKKSSIFDEPEKLLHKEISALTKDLQINNFSAEEKKWFKKGFTTGLKKYLNKEKPVMNVNRFLRDYGIEFSISKDDFLKDGGEK
jgi:glycosyltransferase involved in cell wall biosynthesis